MREYKGINLLDFPNSYTVVDIETTGIDPYWDSIIEVAALKIKDNVIIDSYSSLINPGFLIDSFIIELTGITNEDLSLAPSSSEVLSHLHSFIGEDILLGHNINFDINFLYDNFVKHLGIPLTNNYFDTARFSKKYLKDISSYKLSSLAEYFHITVDKSHRALNDCQTTNHLYSELRKLSTQLSPSEQELLNTLQFDDSNPFYQKELVVRGMPRIYSYTFMKAVSEKCKAKMGDIFYHSCNIIIFGHATYNKFSKTDLIQKFVKSDKVTSTTILSEEKWCKMLNIPIPEHFKHQGTKLDAKTITTTNTDFDETHPLYNKLCAFTGTLEKMPRKEAMQAVVDLGGQVGNSVTKKTNYLILGNNDYCSQIKDGKSSKQKKAESLKLAGNEIEIISENVFYDMILDN